METHDNISSTIYVKQPTAKYYAVFKAPPSTQNRNSGQKKSRVARRASASVLSGGFYFVQSLFQFFQIQSWTRCIGGRSCVLSGRRSWSLYNKPKNSPHLALKTSLIITLNVNYQYLSKNLKFTFSSKKYTWYWYYWSIRFKKLVSTWLGASSKVVVYKFPIKIMTFLLQKQQ